MTTEHATPPHQTAGLIALASGGGLLLLVLLDSAYALPWDMPATWYLHRNLWGAIGLALCAAGWRLQRQRRSDPGTWNPGPSGQRFTRLVVYSRPECHLCDDAKEVLAEYSDYLPRIEDVDINGDAGLTERFGESIPVVEIDGEVRFRGRVDEILLRRIIEATPPACNR